MIDIRGFWTKNWQYVLTTVLLVAGGAWTLYSYFDARQHELAWRRTEFLFEQARYIETDAEIATAIRMLEGRDTLVVAALLAGDVRKNKAGFTQLHALDKLLNVFDRFAYGVYSAETLTVSELEIFAFYLNLIASDPALREYCAENGYQNVLRLARDVGGIATPSIR